MAIIFASTPIKSSPAKIGKLVGKATTSYYLPFVATKRGKVINSGSLTKLSNRWQSVATLRRVYSFRQTVNFKASRIVTHVAISVGSQGSSVQIRPLVGQLFPRGIR